MEERRKYPRVDISFPVECDLLSRRNYFYTVSKDLSLGGAKILTYEFLPKGILLKLDINLINRMIVSKAAVSWCNKERAQERYLAGLKFLEISEENKNSLSCLLNKIQS